MSADTLPRLFPYIQNVLCPKDFNSFDNFPLDGYQCLGVNMAVMGLLAQAYVCGWEDYRKSDTGRRWYRSAPNHGPWKPEVTLEEGRKNK